MAVSQNDYDFDYKTCTLYGDSISSLSAKKYIREGRPTLLVEGETSKKRAKYLAQKYAEYVEILNESNVHESLKAQLKANFIKPPWETERKFHFTYKEI